MPCQRIMPANPPQALSVPKMNKRFTASDEPRIGVFRQPVADRLGEKAAQPLRLDLRDPARRLAVLEPRGRAEQREAAHPFALIHRQLLAEIAACRIADDMGAGGAE